MSSRGGGVLGDAAFSPCAGETRPAVPPPRPRPRAPPPPRRPRPRPRPRPSINRFVAAPNLKLQSLARRSYSLLKGLKNKKFWTMGGGVGL
jgi:hypothetical protein